MRFSLAGNGGERGVEAQVVRAVEMEDLGYEGIFLRQPLISGLDILQVPSAAALDKISLGRAMPRVRGADWAAA